MLIVANLMILRPYQQSFVEKIYNSLGKVQNVLGVLPTGAGKTVIFSHILSKYPGYSCVIAHRQELIEQISLALAKAEVHHSIIAPDHIIRHCISSHILHFKQSFFNDDAKCKLAGVDTLIRRDYSWYKKIELFVVDEAHHLVINNKWDKAYQLLQNAQCLGVTATPERADKKGLGRHASGIMDEMIVGVTMKELIANGYLSQYKVYAPPGDINEDELKISQTGDYTTNSILKALEQSKMTGNVYEEYKKLVNYKQGIIFCVNIEHSKKIAKEFLNKGIYAQEVSSKTKLSDRQKYIEDFKNKKIQILTNCDLFSEGFDCPDNVDFVSFCRVTRSFSCYSQQFGRALRKSKFKKHAYIIDHVGNCSRLGFPDDKDNWTLDDRKRKSGSESIFVSTCKSCFAAFKGSFKYCPYCGAEREITGNRTIEEVAGELIYLKDSEQDIMLTKLRAIRKESVILEKYLRHKGYAIQDILEKIDKHKKRISVLNDLHYDIYKFMKNKKDYEFYEIFGIDLVNAHCLSTDEAIKLKGKINEYRKHNASNDENNCF